MQWLYEVLRQHYGGEWRYAVIVPGPRKRHIQRRVLIRDWGHTGDDCVLRYEPNPLKAYQKLLEFSISQVYEIGREIRVIREYLTART